MDHQSCAYILKLCTNSYQLDFVEIPIDPALSQTATQPPAVQQPQQNLYGAQFAHQQHVIDMRSRMSYYQPYTQTTHYGQTAYSSPLQHYQHYQTAQSVASATISRQPTQTNDNDGADLSNLNDALGSAGVDLRVGFSYIAYNKCVNTN